MEHARDWPVDVLMGIREDIAELRAKMDSMEVRLSRVEDDIRRIDRRIDQLMLTQFVTLAGVLASIVTALVA